LSLKKYTPLGIRCDEMMNQQSKTIKEKTSLKS